MFDNSFKANKMLAIYWEMFLFIKKRFGQKIEKEKNWGKKKYATQKFDFFFKLDKTFFFLNLEKTFF